MTETFMNVLGAQQAAGKFVCIGLDSELGKLPKHLLEDDHGLLPQFVFNRHIIDATAHIAGAYKPNRAFYQGRQGYEALELTVRYIHDVYPNIPVIGDGKWNDIGNTNNGYVWEVFAIFGFDAVTINPYLGMEAMIPFLDREDKGVIVLVRTSNPGAGEFQDVTVTTEFHAAGADQTKSNYKPMKRQQPLYQHVARQVAADWNYNRNCVVVVGATVPEELAKVREIVGDMPILIPGIGAQGGEVEATVKAGANSQGQGMIINSSRGIIFAYKDFPELGERNYPQAAAKAATALHKEITAALAAVEKEAENGCT